MAKVNVDMSAEAVRKPKVSLVVPAYSRPHLLRDCLASIKDQILQDWECIVVDDHSPNGAQILQAVYELNDRRFRYIRRGENGGPAAARNTGVRAARATYFICVDEDDRLVPEALDVLFGEIESCNCDVVCPQARLFGGVSGTRNALKPTLELMLQGMWLLPNGWIMKKELWEAVGGYDEHPLLIGRDDWEIWLRILNHGAKIHVIDRLLYELRTPPGGIGQPGSLEHEARSREVACMKYVIRKHSGLYRRCPEIRRHLLLRSLRTERRWYERQGDLFRACFRSAQVAFYEKSKTEIEKTIKLALLAMFGQAIVSCIRRFVRGPILK